ncbi:cation diffusion facilitator family transporter [Intestinibacillus massiliensis]|uniref:cation diffusion facilitator family transporter n=1 Tax=Intestinibacillus massiliensis TaxID=1871029 RepID=UPI000B357BCE|nr:cation diffusion facilitator family transporter [Intestinibacillus massiliensis]
MTEFLIRHFVRGHDETQNPAVRERYGVLSGAVGILCNAFLFALKLLIGLATHSISIMADAFNNLSDGMSSLISVVGFKVSGKAPDSKHPFGYGRTEYIAGLAVSFLILMVGVEFLKSSVSRIIAPEPVRFSGVLLAILAVSMLVKLWMGAFNRKLGRRIQSPTLLAAMQDSINDVVTTSVVILGMLASRFTTLPVDGYVGVLVALFVLWSGVGIARDTLSPLLGQAADPDIAHSIEEVVLGMDGIVGVHDLIVHNYGAGRSLASLHAEVPDNADFVAIHEVVDEAEKLVWQKTGVYLVIHMDPISLNDTRVNTFRELTQEVLQGLDSRLTMHDFRIVDGKRHINLVFDVVVPFDYGAEARDKLRRDIAAGLRAKEHRLNPVITFDHQM